LALKKNQKYCFGELGNTTGLHSTAQRSTAQHAKLRQASGSGSGSGSGFDRSLSFTKLRQASPSIAKLYIASALKKNQKYCFGELGNTTSMNLNLIYLLFCLFKAIYSYRMCK
jgi:hypothetical protein